MQPSAEPLGVPSVQPEHMHCVVLRASRSPGLALGSCSSGSESYVCLFPCGRISPYSWKSPGKPMPTPSVRVSFCLLLTSSSLPIPQKGRLTVLCPCSVDPGASAHAGCRVRTAVATTCPLSGHASTHPHGCSACCLLILLPCFHDVALISMLLSRVISGTSV